VRSELRVGPRAMQGPGRHFGPGITVLGEAAMCPGRALEERVTSRVALAGALAEQWFGALLVASTAADRWLEWGLQGYLQMLFMRAAYGSNEACYARMKQRDAVRAV
jgi:transcription initiation factor TFIID subunit 2